MNRRDIIPALTNAYRLVRAFWRTLVFNVVGLLHRLLFFNRNEYVTIRIALSSKRRKSLLWFANNLFIPVIIIYLPYLLTLLSEHFDHIKYAKSLIDLSITGALTLLGINVVRVSLSLIDEKIDESRIPGDYLQYIIQDV